MKKSVSIILVVVMLMALCLTGCGGAPKADEKFEFTFSVHDPAHDCHAPTQEAGSDPCGDKSTQSGCVGMAADSSMTKLPFPFVRPSKVEPASKSGKGRNSFEMRTVTTPEASSPDISMSQLHSPL